jgi:glucosamine-6-phosphate deaminase
MAAAELKSDNPILLARERIATHVYGTSRVASGVVARHVEELVKRASADKPLVLGLSIDSALGAVYEELVLLHREQQLSFQHVHAFVLHEYHGLAPHMQELQSFQAFLQQYLLDHVDIAPENVHKVDAAADASDDDVWAACRAQQAALEKCGGLSLALLGVSSSGRIAFHEPDFSPPEGAQVAFVELDNRTRISAASDFFGVESVPTHAVTFTVDAILKAKEVLVLAFGEGKAGVVKKTIEGGVTPSNPASSLQKHPHAHFYIDEAAAAGLTRFECPWVLGTGKGLAEYGPIMERKAVIWLSLQTKKPILRLTEEDYAAHHLLQLAKENGPVYDLNIRVFKHLSKTITGWPGGKAASATTGFNPTYPKRVIVFSPHPDDDVISMGGTFLRLVEQGHDVHVCYQTSGNIAVWDDDARRFAHFATEFLKLFNVGGEALSQIAGIEKGVEGFLASKLAAQADTEEIKKIKGLIRETEAWSAARYCGVKPDHIHNLHLPFYETGKVKKKPLGREDVDIVKSFIDSVKPHQIYCAGDLSDPHGTHRVCLNAIISAMEELKEKEWHKDCEVWLYRGAWQEWEPELIDMAVPMSPHEKLRKRFAIFKHQSQKDPALFPGTDAREFWQRAEIRNRATAELYDKLGLPEYEAIEAFVLFNGKTLNF